MPLGFVKEVSIIHKSYKGTLGYKLGSIVSLKALKHVHKESLWKFTSSIT